MALANVYIELVRNGLGLVAETSDNVCGMVLPGVAVEDKIALNEPRAIYSTDGAKALGIDATGGNAEAWRQIKEFYDVAGNGAKLWVILTAAVTRLSAMVDKSEATAPGRLLVNAGGGEIVAIGLVSGAAATSTVDGLDSEVYAAMLRAQGLADEFTEKMMPYITIIEGKGMTTADALRDLGTENNYRTAVMLGCTAASASASVGLVLGNIAAIPVQRKISRVKNGNLPIIEGYLTDGEPLEGREDLGTINDKRFIIFRKFPNRSGYFFNGDFTATSPTDDLNVIARVRVIDKAMKIAYNTYVEELDDDVEVNTDGTLNKAVAAYLKDKIENQVNNAMSGEISSFEATIDTSIDILAGNAQKIYLDITPKGYLNPIRVILGFKND